MKKKKKNKKLFCPSALQASVLHTSPTHERISGWYSEADFRSGLVGVILYPGGLNLTAETVELQDSLAACARHAHLLHLLLGPGSTMQAML